MNFKCSAVSGRGSKKKKKSSEAQVLKKLVAKNHARTVSSCQREELCILYCLQFPPDLGAAVPTVAGDGRG
jgi:hypothetical protein